MSDPFIAPPKQIPFLLRIGIWISERVTGKTMLPGRILAWYPRAAIGSGVLETLVAHKDTEISERLLKIVRIKASLSVNCAFCIDMNSSHFADLITGEELSALQGNSSPESVTSFSQRELLAIEYARLISSTPLYFPLDFIEKVKRNFNEREMVILASTAAQVNYWARVIQALGIPPAGFNPECNFIPGSSPLLTGSEHNPEPDRGV